MRPSSTQQIIGTHHMTWQYHASSLCFRKQMVAASVKLLKVKTSWQRRNNCAVSIMVPNSHGYVCGEWCISFRLTPVTPITVVCRLKIEFLVTVLTCIISRRLISTRQERFHDYTLHTALYTDPQAPSALTGQDVMWYKGSDWIQFDKNIWKVQLFTKTGMIYRKTDPHCDMMTFLGLIKHVYDTCIGTISSGVTQ